MWLAWSMARKSWPSLSLYYSDTLLRQWWHSADSGAAKAARAAASHWCSGGCFVPSGRPLDPCRAVRRSENLGWGANIDVGGTLQTAAWQRRCARGSLALVQWRLFRSKWTAFGTLQGRRKVWKSRVGASIDVLGIICFPCFTNSFHPMSLPSEYKG